VTIGRTLEQSTMQVLRPHTTVRWRLTLLYSVLFLICGAALLAITYEFFIKFAFSYPPKAAGPNGSPANSSLAELDAALGRVRTAYLHRLLLGSGIALGIMAVVSAVLGWVVAGRVLAPLRTITATTERISATDLHERLAMPGPRDELRLLADTIDRLLARLEAAFDAQRRFVANASHELRTPLAMMRTTLDVAIAKPSGVPEQTRQLDADLRTDLEHADQLLESFLTLARAESGRLEEHNQVALEAILTASVNARVEQIAAKHLRVETHLAAVAASGSSTLLARMIDNVIDNAVRHTEPGGTIKLTLAPIDGQLARMIVDSSGPVLEEDVVDQLAQPFKRLRQDRTGSQNGHGLGLSIVAAVAAAHDGSLELDPRAEGGLRVQITLPGATVLELAQARE
jgi:signal transduction histidine kinase